MDIITTRMNRSGLFVSDKRKWKLTLINIMITGQGQLQISTEDKMSKSDVLTGESLTDVLTGPTLMLHDTQKVGEGSISLWCGAIPHTEDICHPWPRPLNARGQSLVSVTATNTPPVSSAPLLPA